MTTPELAKTCITLAKQLGLSSDNQQEFALEILKQILLDSPMERLVERKAEPLVPTVPDTKKNAKERVKKMVKAAEKHEAKVRKLLCRANTVSACTKCDTKYKVNADIYDGLKAEEFAGRFTPMTGTTTIPIPTRLRAIDGCVMTDCPVCAGDMSLVLWGKKPERDFEDSGVESVGRIVV